MTYTLRGVLTALCFGLSMWAADAGADQRDSASDHDFWLDARMRLEAVSQDSKPNDASALTLRSRIGYSNKSIKNLEFVAEAENIFALDDDYNSTTNGRVDFPVVPDPEDTELNRVLLRYTGIENNRITVGRQRLLFDNARFIGTVAWRQNEQTFDAVSVENTAFEDTTINVVYIDKVRRIFGPDSPNGSTAMSSPLVHVNYDGFEHGELSLYGYFLEFDDAPNTSNQTLGFRFKGVVPSIDNRFDYLVEAALQTDYKSGADSIDAHYLHTGIGFTMAGTRFGVDYNELSGDGSSAFQTPLATAHAFNGWADLFLRTPDDGLQDLNVSVKAKIAGIAVRAVYHEFSADEGSRDFGSEFNFIATRKFANGLAVGLKYADYSADEFGVDTRKFWTWVGVRY